jgi:hypothetical protein
MQLATPGAVEHELTTGSTRMNGTSHPRDAAAVPMTNVARALAFSSTLDFVQLVVGGAGCQ